MCVTTALISRSSKTLESHFCINILYIYLIGLQFGNVSYFHAFILKAKKENIMLFQFMYAIYKLLLI